MAERKVRVRFAPSPTGALHIGGVRTALYNYLFARQHGGDMIFRIEDTDSNRFVPGAEEYILESFKWLGIHFDEGVSFGGEHGPYRQSERREIYKKYVKVLLDNGKAYIAFDTPEELDAKRADLKVPVHPCTGNWEASPVPLLPYTRQVPSTSRFPLPLPEASVPVCQQVPGTHIHGCTRCP